MDELVAVATASASQVGRSGVSVSVIVSSTSKSRELSAATVAAVAAVDLVTRSCDGDEGSMSGGEGSTSAMVFAGRA